MKVKEFIKAFLEASNAYDLEKNLGKWHETSKKVDRTFMMQPIPIITFKNDK